MTKRICKNHVGKRFGRLVVLSEYRKGSYTRIMTCKCDCGTVKDYYLCNLLKKSGHTTSCGCYRIENTSRRSIRHGQCNKTSEYLAWAGMKNRCYNPNNHKYDIYGGRGIIVCERWLNSFENFFEDMGIKPSPNHSLDRYPDVNGNYTPENCRWATEKEQQGNRRDNIWVEYNGEKMILQECANKYNVSKSFLSVHIKKGESIHEIIEWSKIRIKNSKYKCVANKQATTP